MRHAVVALLALAACGRLGFESSRTSGDDVVDGDGVPGDGTAGDGTAQMIDAQMIDAQPATCANAIPIVLGRTGPTSTCTQPDLVDSCGPAGRQEVVFKLVAPASAGYNFAAYNPGTQSVSNSTQLLDVNCVPVPGCAAITGTGFDAGEVVYFVVEASAAACAMIEFQITSP